MANRTNSFLINRGYFLCHALEQGDDSPAFGAWIEGMYESGFNDAQLRAVTSSAMASFCPWHMSS